MKGWYVDDNGRPLAFTEQGAKPGLSDRPFIQDRMPDGIHEPREGRFARWNGAVWVRDGQAEDAWQVRMGQDAQRRTQARQSFAQLRAMLADDTTDWASPVVVKGAVTRLATILREIARQLDD